MPVQTIPPLLLEQLAAGELSDDRRQAVMRQYACSEDDLERLLEAHEADNAEILRSYPASEFANHVQGHLASRAPRRRAAPSHIPSRRSRLAIPGALTAAATAALAFVALSRDNPSREISPPQRPPLEDHIILKGERPDALRVWRHAEPEHQRLEQGDTVHDGDTLQLEYFTPKNAPGVIFSMDGRGVVTLHHPENASSAAMLEQGTHPLPYSYTLDDAPDYERFVLVQCSHDIDPDTLLAHARDFASTDPKRAQNSPFTLPDGHDCTSHSIWLSKESR